ncbi:hypothetical protein LCGC14_0209480 [marine sediment metagenome]|uniref:Uncharacterized protein n=1 Tax=marine sediment metagenome TaxID=412755 RepID=A0A0F9UY68_9ZZZZ
MGKRMRNPRTVLPSAAGFSKIRYCRNHNKPVKAVKLFGRKSMKFHCDEGCKLDKSRTILKVPEGPQKR